MSGEDEPEDLPPESADEATPKTQGPPATPDAADDDPSPQLGGEPLEEAQSEPGDKLPDNDRTVFKPFVAQESGEPPAAPPTGWGDAPAGSETSSWDLTPTSDAAPASDSGWGAPSPTPAQPPEPAATRFEPPPAASAPPPPPPPGTSFGAAGAARGEAQQIKVGDVLNHMFQVRRFIARGGMGEVFEGVAVDAEHDRVAIKVMLPHLAADPLVRSMFSREAQTLVKLRHPGLVQYRVVGTDPQLGVSYIVTDFVDGPSLQDVLRTIEPQTADLLSLAKRLSGALGAAHELGAIHRDIAPDNVLLEDGRLDRAKIIDFGIAKDLDPGTGTIVGDGFAGKLNYVAPEQLGSYGRNVGPWTDVYSLGLVLLAAARKRDVDMGGSLADAFEKRTRVPDLSPAPEPLRPILERMLQPDPAQRLRSMDDVQALLSDPARAAAAPAPTPTKPSRLARKPKPPKPLQAATERPADSTAGPLKDKRVLIGGGAALAVVLAGLAVWGLSGGGDEAPVASADNPAGAAAPGDPVQTARAALASGVSSIPCAWLDVAGLSGEGGGVSLNLRGVAGDPADAQQRLTALLSSRGVTPKSIDLQDVAPIAATGCAPIEAFRAVRDPEGGRLSVAQRQFEMSIIQEGSTDDGKLAAKAIVDFNFGGLPADAAIYGLEENGEIQAIITSRAQAQEIGGEGDPHFQALGGERYRITVTTDHKSWSGLLLVTGQKPGDAALIAGPAGSHDAAWQSRFEQAARERGWKTEMVWYKTVDDVPNAAPSAG